MKLIVRSLNNEFTATPTIGPFAENKEATTTVAPVRSVQKRADGILKYGLMPLCVPVRRDWNTDGILQLDIGTSSLLWPPTGWKMSPNRRLVTIEYVANSIDHQTPFQDCLEAHVTWISKT